MLDVRPGALITVRSSARWTKEKTLDNLFDYHIEWKLPHWQQYLKKMKLYFESRSDTNQFTTQPGEPVDPGVDPNTGAKKSLIGVRADLFSRLHNLVTIDSGVKMALHPDAHIRMRHQYVRPFSEVYVLRFSEIAMYQAVEHFTNTVELDLDRKISTFKFIRWGNYVTYTEGTAGVTWNTGVTLFTQLTPKSAIAYGANIWGVSHPDWILQNYRLGSNYRRNFYRPWLFFELAPEVDWPINPSSHHRKSTYAFLATLEIQFGR